MAAQRPPRKERPRGKSPAERAEEAADHQRQLKREATERREAAAKKSAKRPRPG